MAKIPLYRGREQAFILNCHSDQDKHYLLPFNKYPIRIDSDVGLPFYKAKDTCILEYYNLWNIRKATSHYFSNFPSDQGTFKRVKRQLGFKCSSSYGTLKGSIKPQILTTPSDCTKLVWYTQGATWACSRIRKIDCDYCRSFSMSTDSKQTFRSEAGRGEHKWRWLNDMSYKMAVITSSI
jgi:hypothetical protein